MPSPSEHDPATQPKDAAANSAAYRSRFFTVSPDLLAVIAADGLLQDVNPAWEQMLGVPLTDLRGRSYLSFVDAEDRAAAQAALDLSRRGGTPQTFEVTLRHESRPAIRVLWTAIHVLGEPLLYLIGRDITEQRRRERRLTLQHSVTRLLAACSNVKDIASQLLQMICEAVSWEVGALWVVDAEAALLRCVAVWHRPDIDVPQFLAVSGVMTFPLGIGLPGRAWSSRAPVWVPDVVHDTNFPRMPFVASSGLHGGVAIPIEAGSAVTGVVEFFTCQTHPPAGEVLEVVRAVGSQVGQFMVRQQVEEERERLIGQLQAAVANVKTLKGLLPICASCNKIRDDRGAWNRLEDYISAHAEVLFTHGICTDCARKQHPDWDDVP